jgi:uncharacterized membrane protein YfcA
MAYFAVCCTDIPHAAALGTTNCAMLPALAASSLAHWRKGGVRTQLLPFLCAGTTVGGFLGATLVASSLLGEDTLKMVLGLSLPLLGGLAGRKAWAKLFPGGMKRR